MALIAALSGGQVLAIAIPVLVLLAAALVMGAAARRDRNAAIGQLARETRRADRSDTGRRAVSVSGKDVERRAKLAQQESTTAIARAPSAPPAPFVPPDQETLGVTRRQFLNRSIVNVMGFSLTAFGLSTLGFLWPQSSGGFGSKISVGKLADIKAKIADGEGFAYYPEGRMWITEYPASALSKARQVYPPAVLVAMEAGIVPLYQRCPHLGCRVPQCLTSQWFECPCHGSQYNQVGEKKGGPAPRGMDRFPATISGTSVSVDTGTVIEGPPIGTNTTGQEAEGPHCITAGGE